MVTGNSAIGRDRVGGGRSGIGKCVLIGRVGKIRQTAYHTQKNSGHVPSPGDLVREVGTPSNESFFFSEAKRQNTRRAVSDAPRKR